MPSNDNTDPDIDQAHETHERKIKRSLESFGSVEENFQDVVEAVESDRDPMRDLEALGKSIENLGTELESLIRSFDELKRLSQQDDSSTQGYRQAIEKARRRARQEPTPNGKNDHESP